MLTSPLIPCLLATLLSPGPTSDPPNLLIILADDVGVDNVGVYGEGPNPPDTPTIDGASNTSTNYATTETVDLALEWLASSADRPWLMLVAFNAPHQPFHAPPADLHDEDLPISGPLMPRINPKPYYNAMVTAMDTEIGNLLRGLGDELEHTTIFFLGDNGTPNQVAEDPFLPNHAKATPFEGGINVPLIVAGYGVTRPGREVTQLVHSTDLFATCADLAGIDLPASMPDDRIIDSVSLTPYLARRNAAAQRSTVFSELFFEQEGRPAIYAIRDLRFKLIRVAGSNGRFDLLFDLESDPFEADNLLARGPYGLSALAAAHYAFLDRELEDLLATREEGHQASGNQASGNQAPRSSNWNAFRKRSSAR